MNIEIYTIVVQTFYISTLTAVELIKISKESNVFFH